MSSDSFHRRKNKLVLTQFVVLQSSHGFNFFNIKHFHKNSLIVLLQIILKKIIACTRKGCENKLKNFRAAGHQKGWEPLI